MADTQPENQDADVPELAVQALTAAHRRAAAAGRTLIVVRNGQLLRISPTETVILRQLPARKKVGDRIKFAKS